MTGRSLLLSELERIVGNCCRFFELVKAEHNAWRPREGIRSLVELANHLAQVPGVDLRIMKGTKEEELIELERKLARDDGTGWAAVMREGAEDLSRFVQHLSLDQFENGSGTAYYGRTQTHAQWLLEAITHIYHHRSQLFLYLKLNGYEVSTRTLYE